MVTVFWRGSDNHYVSDFFCHILNICHQHQLNLTIYNNIFLNKIHCAVPKVSSNGELILKTKRLMDHVLIPELMIYLLEHTRTCNFLFHKLKSKIIRSIFVSKIVQSKSFLDFRASDWAIFETMWYRLYQIDSKLKNMLRTYTKNIARQASRVVRGRLGLRY